MTGDLKRKASSHRLVGAGTLVCLTPGDEASLAISFTLRKIDTIDKKFRLYIRDNSHASDILREVSLFPVFVSKLHSLWYLGRSIVLCLLFEISSAKQPQIPVLDTDPIKVNDSSETPFSVWRDFLRRSYRRMDSHCYMARPNDKFPLR